MYFIVKHFHLTFVLLSVSFLVIRVIAAMLNAQWITNKWARIAPHILDTLLLASAIFLMLLIQQYPIVNHWLSVKVIGLIAYIIFAARALKAGKNVLQRSLFLLLALGCIVFVASVAMTKSPLPFM